MIQEVRNSALSPRVSGDIVELRPIGRDSAESSPFAASPAGRRIREPPKFAGFSEDIQDSRPRIREVRDSALSRQVSGDFDDYRPAGRECCDSAPSPSELAGRRISEQPIFFRIL